MANEYTCPNHGVLRIATTNTQARYMLPAVVERFSKQYPDVSLHIHQGSPTQIHDALISGEVDLAITTEAPLSFDDLIQLPCYLWNRSSDCETRSSFSKSKNLTVEELGKYPLVTYTFGFTGVSDLDYAFNRAGIFA